jgi:hypothetical protein
LVQLVLLEHTPYKKCTSGAHGQIKMCLFIYVHEQYVALSLILIPKQTETNCLM